MSDVSSFMSAQDIVAVRKALSIDFRRDICLCERRAIRTDIERAARALALDAMLFELNVTPKPGLVDARNSGAHADMHFELLEASARAICIHIGKCARTAYELACAGAGARVAFMKLREIGIAAQRDMLRLTRGVNTHKGAVFCLGLLAGALGSLLARAGGEAARTASGRNAELPAQQCVKIYLRGEALTDAICAEASRLCLDTLAEELSAISKSLPATNGERAYVEYGLAGARGEALSGFLDTRRHALPAFRNAARLGESENEAAVRALLALISLEHDTCVYARGGAHALKYAADAARALSSGARIDMEDVKHLDDAFIARHISPGGCADLLAAARFLWTLERLTTALSLDN